MTRKQIKIRYSTAILTIFETWIANDQKIGTTDKKILPVPYGNMRIKLFAAPQNPREDPPDVHIEQVMQVFSLSHRKYAIKDEMRLEDESRHGTYLWLFAMGFAAFLVVLYSYDYSYVYIPGKITLWGTAYRDLVHCKYCF